MAEYLIKCSVNVIGGDFTGFKSLAWSGINDFGYPIVEIASDGDVVIMKPEGTVSLVSVETCKRKISV